MPRIQEGRVEVEEGVVFGSGGSRPLRCDVYRPPEPGTRRVGVLLLHGGGWSRGDRSQLRGYGILLGRMGFVCVASEYRLTGEARWPAQLFDAKAALRWMRAESDALGIDPTRIAAQGNSAGAHLALMLGGTPNRPEFEGHGGNADAGSGCAACIAVYAPTQLLGANRRGSTMNFVADLFDADASDDVVRGASPITYASKDFPPTLLIHGNRDEIVPPAASLNMYGALADVGAEVELHMFAGAPHGFDAERALGHQCAELMALFLSRYLAK
jgi:acetyl esterase/lipase